jgi:acyl transferase domain-containing protein/acyl carrier protein
VGKRLRLADVDTHLPSDSGGLTLPPDADREAIRDWLVRQVTERVGAAVGRIDTSEPFSRYGLGSIEVTTLVAALGRALGRSLASSVVWSHPTIDALARQVAEGSRPGELTEGHREAALSGDGTSEEPIAIVGMACRFPGGADDPVTFWKLLCEGFDAISEVPSDRWNMDLSAPPAMRRGGFLRRIDGFDPLLFRISPREAEQMDPQQRLVLELSWEAIEDARINPRSLAGSPTGVFTGVVFGDYDAIQNAARIRSINQYSTTGSVQAIIANRVSYVLGLQGPSMVVNAACASSLLAVHLACQSLRSGECTSALAGGVQLNLASTTALGVSKFGALSPDGICRTFDAGANGYVRGEGGGVVVLRRLSEARRRGDQVYAMIRGSAVNNDGHSNGLTAPNPDAQHAVLLNGCRRARVEPSSVQYVELHGTATILGDPIEASALGGAYRPNGMAGGPLLVGSVKTNIGHLEASAGIAGLIKTTLALHHRRLPPSIHFESGNPNIDFDALRLEVVTAARAWPDTAGGPLRAGVSSFGFGGTNVHAILEAAHGERLQILPLAAESAEQLERLVSQIGDWLVRAPEGISTGRICSAAGVGLTSGPERVAVIGASREVLARALQSVHATAPRATDWRGDPPQPVFVFSGLGSQWAGMVRRIFDVHPAFAAALRQCDAQFEPIGRWSLLNTLLDDGASASLDGTDALDVIVPVLVAVQISMARLWKAWGVEPSAVIGHSVGEVSAAHIAGVLDLREAMLVAYHLGLAYRASVDAGTGVLAFVACVATEVEELLQQYDGRAHFAGENGPDSYLISGEAASVHDLVGRLVKRGFFARALGNVHAHGPPARRFTGQLADALKDLKPGRARTPLISSVLGCRVTGLDFDALHWRASIEEPVRFRSGIAALHEEGHSCFLEMSPHSVLTRSIASTLKAAGSSGGLVFASQVRSEDGQATLLATVARLFEAGVRVRWDVVASTAATPEALPPGLWGVGAELSDRQANLFVLSAKSEQAMRAQAQRLREHMQAHGDVALADIAYSLATTRTHFEHRAALVAHDRTELLDALEALAQGQPTARTVLAQGRSEGKLAVLFTGQGSQRPRMGRALYDVFPVFRDALDAVCAHLDRELPRPLREVMFADETSPNAGLLDQTVFTQPALFALEVALFRLLESFGLKPDLILGHSIGELVAAHLAGVLSLQDACTLVGARGSLMQALPQHGAMVALQASEDEVSLWLAGRDGRAGLAALNAPDSTVVAGDSEAVAQIAAHFEGLGRKTTRLRVSHAFHSPHMDGMLEAFRRVAQGVTLGPARLGVVSNVTGSLASNEQLASPDYWVRQVRQPVRFVDGIRALDSLGVRTYVELGPDAVLSALAQRALPEGDERSFISALRKARSDVDSIVSALGELHVRGLPLDWRAFFAPFSSKRVALPTYAFQREKYWVEATKAQSTDVSSAGQSATDIPLLVTARGMAMGHSLLGVRIGSAGEALYEKMLSATEPSWLSEHRVGDRLVVPGAAVAELARAAGEEHGGGVPCQVTCLVFQAPLIVPESGLQRVQAVLSEGGTRIGVYSQPGVESGSLSWTLHATAELSPSPAAAARPEDLSSIRRRCTEPVDVGATYEAFASVGLAYGPSFQGLRAFWRGSGEALGEVTLDPGVAVDGYGLHPALLDAALQAIVVAVGPESLSRAMLPFELGRVVVHQSAATSAMVHVRLGDVSADGIVADVTLMDGSGVALAHVERVRMRPAEIGSLHSQRGHAPEALYRLEWQGLESAASKGKLTGRWAVVACGEVSRTESLVDELRARGASVESVSVDGLGEVLSVDHVVCAWGEGASGSTAVEMAQAGLLVAQGLVSSKSAARLWWVTRGSMSVTGESLSPSASSVWGLGRTLMQEHPELRCTLVDVESSGSVSEAVSREVACGDEEAQVAWRGGRRHVARLLRASEVASFPGRGHYELRSRRPGTLDSLTLVAARRRAPGAGEVEIEVAWSGVNFRDVLMALGMYPGEVGALGGECSGVICGVGPGVSGWSAGDEVMALAPGAMGRYVTVDARLVSRVPRGLTSEEASTVPVVFLTAWYALHDLGSLRRGERLLVHAAAGGVGMAAVQLAQWIGAEVLATASAGKWEVVRSLGVSRVANSRDLSFVESFRSTSSGSPVVDVVLNSLAGEFVDGSLSLLSSGGRFLEMGKTDIRDESAVTASHPGVSYRAFDLMDAGLDRIATMFAQVVDGFESGRLKALPVRSFSVTEAEAAFRFLGQAHHVGKLALRPLREPLRVKGTVLVTGGLGALGLQVARRLARRGVKHLVLTGRRGFETPGAREAVAELESLGARVTVSAVDVADRAALSQLLSQVPAESPLRGVVHAAGVLDDGILADQTAGRFERVMRPKAEGAWNLHELTAELDLFVMFSSVAGTLGSAGQSSYAAANAYLDGLAAYRRARGLAGVSLAWGPWSEGGMAAALDAISQARLARQGLGTISRSQGMSLLEQALSRPEAQLVVSPIDLRAVAKGLGACVPPVWRALVRAPSTRGAVEKGTWAREVASLPADKRVEAVTQMVRVEVARVLGLGRGASAVPADKAFKELGLDSLMAVELRNALGRRAGVTLPATLAFDHPTPVATAEYLLSEALSTADADATGTDHGSVKAAIRTLSALSDEQWRDERLRELVQGKLARKRADTKTEAVPDNLAALLELVDHL